MSDAGLSCELYPSDGSDLTDEQRERLDEFVQEFQDEHDLANEVGEPFAYDVSEAEQRSARAGRTQKGVSITLTEYWLPELEQTGVDPGEVVRYDLNEAQPFIDGLREEFGDELDVDVETGVW